MTFKTIITDVNTLGVAIDKVNAIIKANTSSEIINGSLFGTALDGLSAKQIALTLSTQELSDAQLKEIVIKNNLISKYDAEELIKVGLISANSSLLASEKAVDAEIVESALLNAGLNEKLAEGLILKYSSIVADGEEAASKQVLVKAMMDEAVQRGYISAEKAQEILSTYGIVTADVAETASKEALTVATWAQVKAQLALIASNPMTWIMAIPAIIYGAVKAYDALTTSTEEIKEAAEEAKSAIDTIKSDFDSLTSTTNDVKERFAELAQGVENLGKVNQSRGTLSTDDYGEFLDLSNHLAELFPQLTKGYDDNGNAILDLSGNVDTIVGSLDNLVSVQQKLANQEILEKMPDVWTGYTANLKEYTEELDVAETRVNSFIDALSDIDYGIVKIKDFKTNSAIEKALKEALDIDWWKDDKLYRKSTTGADIDTVTWDFSTLTESQFDQLKNELGALSSEYEDAVQLTKSKIESANSEMSSYINTWLSGEWNYSKMSSDMQNVVKDVLQNSDWISQLPVDSGNWDEVSNWLQQEFLYAINNIDNTEIQTALVDAFDGDFTVESLRETINQLLNVEGFDVDNPLIIYLQAKLDDAEEIDSRIKKSLTDIYDKDGNHTVSSSDEKAESEKLKKYTKDFSDAQWEAWITATAGAENATDAIQKYEEALASGSGPDTGLIPSTISSSISQIATQLEPQFAKLGEAYKAIFTDDGFTLDDVDSSMLEGLRQSFAEIEEEVGAAFDATQLEPFFDALTTDYDNAEDGAKNVQQAFNDLATAYFYSTDTLDQLNAETADAIQKQLEEMGVANAQTIVADALTAKTEELLVQKQYLAETGKELSSATEEEVTAFIAEQIEAGNCGQALALLKIQKILCNENWINSTDDISNLLTLANAAGITSDALGQLYNLKMQYDNAAPQAKAAIAAQMEALKAKIEAEFANVRIDFSGVGGGTSSASSAGSDAGDAYVEAFEKELAELDDLRDRGIINESTYLKRLRELYERYFKDRKEYLDEYNKYERQYLEGKHTCPAPQ